MPYLYVKKENGKIVEKKLITGLRTNDSILGSVPYFTADENCFVNRLHIDPESLNRLLKEYYTSQLDFTWSSLSKEEEDLVEVVLASQDYVTKMLRYIKKTPQADRVLKDAFDQIKNSQTKKDLRKVLSVLCHGYRNAVNELVQNDKIDKSVKQNNGVGIYRLFDQNPNVVLAVTLKMVTHAYFEQKFYRMSPEEFNAFQKNSKDGVSSEQLLEQMGETFSETAKKNGVDRLAARAMKDQLNTAPLKRLQRSGIDSIGANKRKMLCFSCENRTCPVIYCWGEKSVERFPYVTDAVQIISSEEGKTDCDDEIMVFGCEQYATKGNQIPPKVLQK